MNLTNVMTVLTDQRDAAELRRKEAAIRVDNLRANMEANIAAVNRATALRDEYQAAIQILETKDDRPTLAEADPPELLDEILADLEVGED